VRQYLCIFVVISNYAMKGVDFVAKKLKIKLKHDTLDLETCYFDQIFNYLY
jgi:hypothetical protein